MAGAASSRLRLLHLARPLSYFCPDLPSIIANKTTNCVGSLLPVELVFFHLKRSIFQDLLFYFFFLDPTHTTYYYLFYDVGAQQRGSQTAAALSLLLYVCLAGDRDGYDHGHR